MRRVQNNVCTPPSQTLQTDFDADVFLFLKSLKMKHLNPWGICCDGIHALQSIVTLMPGLSSHANLGYYFEIRHKKLSIAFEAMAHTSPIIHCTLSHDSAFIHCNFSTNYHLQRSERCTIPWCPATHIMALFFKKIAPSFAYSQDTCHKDFFSTQNDWVAAAVISAPEVLDGWIYWLKVTRTLWLFYHWKQRKEALFHMGISTQVS